MFRGKKNESQMYNMCNAYISDFAPYDFHIFLQPRLRICLKGESFTTTKALGNVKKKWLQSILASLHEQCINP